MIDYKTFLITMNKTVYNKYSKSMNQGDNWSWEDDKSYCEEFNIEYLDITRYLLWK